MTRRGAGSLSGVRAAGFVSVFVWFVAVVVYVSRPHRGESVAEVPVIAGVSSSSGAVASGHSLRITVLRTTKLRVALDGASVIDRRVEPREELGWEGARTFIVEGAAPEALRIVWNGQRVVPLGRQDEPRRLVFVDDAEERR